MTDAAPEQPSSVYALRFTSRARRDIDAAHTYLTDTTDEEIADEWQSGSFATLATLATTPRRFAMAVEGNRFRQEVRQLFYRRRAGSVAYRILFTIIEGQEDAPVVRILHVRHSASRPLKRKEAREMETET